MPMEGMGDEEMYMTANVLSIKEVNGTVLEVRGEGGSHWYSAVPAG